MKKIIKYAVILLLIGLVGYKSVYFKKLSEMGNTTANFDAVAFSRKLWNEQLPPRLDSAIGLSSLVDLVEANPDEAFAKYSHAMGIGNYRYCLVKASGFANVINEDDIVIQINHHDSLMIVKVATEFIYGNAVRDASGLVDIKDFTNTSDLNNISEELNKIIRTAVLPEFKKKLKQGDRVEVTGAVQFNKEHINFIMPELIPVRIKIVN